MKLLPLGPINSPQLLMLSGIGPKEHLNSIGLDHIWMDLPVGYYLRMQPTIYNFGNIIKNDTLVNAPQMLELQQMYQAYLLGKGALTENSNLILYANSRLNRDKEWPNLSIGTSVGYKNSVS